MLRHINRCKMKEKIKQKIIAFNSSTAPDMTIDTTEEFFDELDQLVDEIVELVENLEEDSF